MEVSVFTYTRLDTFGKVKSEGLIPQSKVIPRDFSSPMAVFGLLDPQPFEWRSNERYPYAWRSLKTQLTPFNSDVFCTHGGRLLLVLSLDTQRDEAAVVDWAPMEEYKEARERLLGLMATAEAYGNSRTYNEYQRQLSERRLRASVLRRESMMPLEGYLKLDPAMRTQHFFLPEVVIFSVFPSGSIRVCKDQPLLMEGLEESMKSFRRDTIAEVEFMVSRHPEVLEFSPSLKEWFSDFYQQEKGRKDRFLN